MIYRLPNSRKSNFATEPFHSRSAHPVLFAMHPRQAQGIGEKPTARLTMHTHHDVLEDRHGLEQGEILERASNPERRHLRGRQRHEGTMLEEDLAPVWGIQPTETVKEGGFARPVRADEANNVPFCHLKRDPIQCHDAPELHRQVLYAQDG